MTLAALVAGPVPAGERQPPPAPEVRDAALGIGRRVDRTRLAEHPHAKTSAVPDVYDATEYRIELDFDEVARHIRGAVTMTATGLVEGLDQVVLDLDDAMQVTRVTRDIRSQAFNHDQDALVITLDPPVASGESFVLRIDYNGAPASSGGVGSFGWNKYRTSGNGEMVWSLSEPEGARLWWPCKDRPDDKAMVETWWTVRPDWIATGNGRLLGEDTLPGGRKRYRWRSTYPLTTYLVSIAATDFVTFSDSYTSLDGTKTVPVDNYVYPEDLLDAEVSLAPTVRMMQFFAALLGEYPFVDDKYGHSAFPFGGAMEHTSNTSYGYVLMNGANTYDFVVAHELAHQWFGDSVSPQTWPDIWLNEGFASHSEALWFESLGGPLAYQDYMNGMERDTFSGTVYDPSSLFGSTVYNKGAWVQHMLRGAIGDEAFFLTLRDWYAEYKDGVGNTAQYQATAEGRHGASLDWFFEEWVYAPNRPHYQFGYSTANLGNGMYRTWLRIRQIQSDAGVFTMPIRLMFYDGGPPQQHTVWNDAADQYLTVDSASPPSVVTFDEADWILKRDGAAIPINLADTDFDGVPDGPDNCQTVANPDQADTDADLAGNACDADDDNDLLPDHADCAPLDATQGRPGEVETLVLDREDGTTATLSWSPAVGAETYSLVFGPLPVPAAEDSCTAQGLVGTDTFDAAPLAPGEGRFYFVAGQDDGCGGAGSFGTSSDGTPRTPTCNWNP